MAQNVGIVIVMNRDKLAAAIKREMERFLARTPKSKALFEDAKKVMPGGVPMSWMSKWPGLIQHL